MSLYSFLFYGIGVKLVLEEDSVLVEDKSTPI